MVMTRTRDIFLMIFIMSFVLLQRSRIVVHQRGHHFPWDFWLITWLFRRWTKWRLHPWPGWKTWQFYWWNWQRGFPCTSIWGRELARICQGLIWTGCSTISDLLLCYFSVSTTQIPSLYIFVFYFSICLAGTSL